MRQTASLLAGAVALLSALPVLTGPLGAQAAKAPGRGEVVWLLARPRVGDTLRLQMEQTIEISGRRSDAPQRPAPPLIDGRKSSVSPKGADYGPRRARANTRVTRLLLFAHSLVEASDLTMTTLLATTDSMSMLAGTAKENGRPQRMALPAEGRQVRVRVTPDGAMRVNDPPPGAMELGATLASMPGMLPDRQVAIGER